MAPTDQEKEDLGLSTRMTTKLPKLPPPAILGAIPPPGLVRLEQAENKLLRPELVQFCKDAINEQLDEETFNYPKGFGGEPQLRDALASFFNTYFHPTLPVQSDHISVTSGTGTAFDALLCTICDEGDIVLTPSPLWTGFYIYSQFHASATVVPVPSPTFRDSLTDDCVSRLITAYDSHPNRDRIKALLITNPHNPADDTYAPSTVRKLMDFCHERNLHYISDEIEALCDFNTDPEKPFASALSLVKDDEGIRRSRVHVIWGASKDFGSAGVRMACLVSQANAPLIHGVTFSAFWQISILSSIYISSLLTSPQLPKLLELNKQRLKASYNLLTSKLDEWGMEYIPVKAGIMIFVKLAKDVKTWEEDAALIAKVKEGGVLVTGTRMWGGIDGEMGWARMLFAVKEDVLKDALEKMERVLLPKKS